MKLAFINPNESGRWFREGSERKCGKWTYVDVVSASGVRERYIKHHGTVMGKFVETPSDWVFLPISTGWGSASDQQGMNKIMPSAWRYRRNGGNARYILNGVDYTVAV
jgi:hypothetical protein